MLTGLSTGLGAVTAGSTTGSVAWDGAGDDDWDASVFIEGAQYVELPFFPDLGALSVCLAGLGGFGLAAFLVLAFCSLRASFLRAAAW